MTPRPARVFTPATPEQVRFIHILRRKSMDEDAYRELLQSRYGCASTKELSLEQASALIDDLKGVPQAKRRFPEQRGGATYKQEVWLRENLGFWPADPLRWLSRCVGRNIEEFADLTSVEAAKAIQAAMRMRRARDKRAGGMA